MNTAIDESKTLFHGITYEEKLDRKRFTAQLKRIADALQSEDWIDAINLCMKADVSYSALRNRISDLRVYHAFKIQSERVRDGLWRYRFDGLMTVEEHTQYLANLKMKKAVGDPQLWGEMWRTIYALAFKSDLVNEAAARAAAERWALNMAHRIYTESRA